jgi:hypothetical protein
MRTPLTGETSVIGRLREKKGRLEVRRVSDIENLVDAVDRVHYIIILILHSWSKPHIIAG